MIRLRHRLIVIVGFVILIAAVAALDAGRQHPLGHDVAVVDDDPQTVFASTNDSTLSDGAIHALFDLNHLKTAPFPSGIFTVADRTHNTRRRVNLPYPDCAVRVSDCEDIAILNSLDGFNLQPRLSVPFSGSIDANSVTSDTVFLMSLGSTRSNQSEMPAGTVVGINQVVWDTFTTTLHLESNALLAQHTRFALIVTRGVRDEGGARVRPSDAFRRFRQIVRGEYKQALIDAIHEARRVGVRERDIAVASVFTTQSATAVLEKMRDQIHAAIPEPADFLLGPQGERTVFSLAAVTDVRFDQQTGAEPPVFTQVNLNRHERRIDHTRARLSLRLLRFAQGLCGQRREHREPVSRSIRVVARGAGGYTVWPVGLVAGADSTRAQHGRTSVGSSAYPANLAKAITSDHTPRSKFTQSALPLVP